MKRYFKKIALLAFTLSMSSASFAIDDNSSPDPSECHGLEILGVCVVHLF